MDDNDTTLTTDAAENEEITTEATDTSDGNSQTTVLLSLEELVKSHITSIDKLTDELKKYRQMFADGFENNPTFRELEEQAKDAAKKKNTAREEILKQPSMQDLGKKIKDANSELREKKNSLSDYLLEYQRLAGVNEIEGEDGQMRVIINSAKLIKLSSREIAQSQQK